MKAIREYEDLDVYQVSMELVRGVYEITKSFPPEEKFGLSLQMRRAAVSIPSNIAEGASRHSGKETIQFLYIALASLAEVETQVEIARDLDYIHKIGPVLGKILRVRAMLLGLVKGGGEIARKGANEGRKEGRE
jgi:four helix bundle protein